MSLKRITGTARDSISFMSVSADIMKSNTPVMQYVVDQPTDFAVVQVYYSPKKCYLLLPASKVASMSVKQLVELVAAHVGSDTNLSAMLKSPSNFSLLLRDDDLPFSFCDALFFLPIDGNESRTKPRQFYIQMYPKSDTKQTHAFIPVIDDKAELLYLAPLSFTYDQFKVKYIIQFLSRLHQTPPEKFTAFDRKGVVIREFGNEKEFIRSLIFNSIYISFKPDDSIKKQINKRVCVLSEFRDTELRYYKTLEGFEENVGNVFKKTNFLSKEESDAFMTSSHYIITLHEQIANDFQTMRIDYMTLIGQWFKKYVPFLKVYHQYVGFYKAFLPKITAALNSKQYASVFKDFTNSDYANGLVFDSVLIIPVQRGPRYQLLLREVLKSTPETHPDYTMLSEALELTKDTLKKLEQDVSLVERRQKMVQLENWFSDKVTIFQPNRLYINTFFLQVKDKKFVFILFSDEFWMAKTVGEKLVLEKAYAYSDVDLIKYAEKSVVLRVSEYDKVCLLETKEQRDLLISQFRETAICFIQRQRDQIQLHYQNVQVEDKLVELADHSMCYEGGTFWIFGGRDSKNQPNGCLYRFALDKNDTQKPVKFDVYENKNSSSEPCPRYLAAFTSIKTGLFVFGGTIDGKEALGDLWFFSFKSNKWGRITDKGDVPPPGFGLQLASFGDCLILSGGKDEFGLYKFILKTKEWQQVQLSKGIEIMSLYGHCYVPIENTSGGGGNALVIGGRSGYSQNGSGNGEFNNYPIYISKYGTVTNYVRLTGINPNSRFNHKCVVIGDNLYCFGASSSSIYTNNNAEGPGNLVESIPFVLQLPLSNWTVPQIEGVKCNSIEGFALATDGESILIHGGRNKDGKVVGSFMKVEVKLPAGGGENSAMSMFISSISFDKDKFVYNMVQNPKSNSDDNWI